MAHGTVTFNRPPPSFLRKRRQPPPTDGPGEPLYEAALKNVMKETSAGYTTCYALAVSQYPELHLPPQPDHHASTFSLERGDPPKSRLVFNDSAPKYSSINNAIISPGALYPTNDNCSEAIISTQRKQGLVDWVSAFKTQVQRPDQWVWSVYWAPGLHIRQPDGSVQSSDLQTWHSQMLFGENFGRTNFPRPFNNNSNMVSIHAVANGAFTATNFSDDHFAAAEDNPVFWQLGCPLEMSISATLSLFETIIHACGAGTDRKGTTTASCGVYTGVERDIAKGVERAAAQKLKKQQVTAQALLDQRTHRGGNSYVPTALLEEYVHKTNYHANSMPLGRIFLSTCFFSLNKAISAGRADADCPKGMVEELEFGVHCTATFNSHGVPLPHMKPQLEYISKWDNNGDAFYKPRAAARLQSVGGYAYFCIGVGPDDPARLRWRAFTRKELDEMERNCPRNPIILCETQCAVRSAVYNAPRAWRGRATDFGEDNTTAESWMTKHKAGHLAGAGMIKTIEALTFANGCRFSASRLDTKQQLISDLGSRMADEENRHGVEKKLGAALCMWRVGHWLRTGRYVDTIVEQDDDHHDELYIHRESRDLWVKQALAQAASGASALAKRLAGNDCPSLGKVSPD